jgi:uncharacterized protein (TIGR02300 family)
MSTASELSKATRGTKRSCLSCEVRFYDLARDPIVCPACSAVFTPVVQPVYDVTVRSTSGGKTGWRSKTFKRPDAAVPVADAEEAAVPEAVVAEDAVEEAPSAGADDDIVLEQEADDGDVSGLVDHDVEEEPKDR